MKTAHCVCQAEVPRLHSPSTRDPLKTSGPHDRRNKPDTQREWKEEEVLRDFRSKNDRT